MSHIQPHKKNSRWDFIRKLFAHDRLRQLTCFPHLLLFVLLWVFCSWVYDDVFYMTEQFSFFSFDPVLMEEITSLTLAPMVWSGRFLLLVFKYPLLGGMLYAAMLTAIAWLIGRLLPLKGWGSVIGLLLPWLWMAGLLYLGLNIFYRYEPSYVGSYPLIALLLLSIVYGVVRLLKKKGSCQERGQHIASFLVAVFISVASFLGTTAYALTVNANTIATTRMQRLLQKQDWYKMIETAQQLKQPSRPVACYYAIALEMTDQLIEKMFDIYYQYPNIKLVNRTGGEDVGNFMYEPDADFYCGLVNPSYHLSMEHMVASGKTIYRLKQLFLCALVNNEIPLANKYMYMLEKVPFEGDFVKKYKPMIYDRSLVLADPVLSLVIEMMPLDDSYEETYINPLFLGYYKQLREGRSPRVYKNCLAAHLYTKELERFLSLLEQNPDNYNAAAFYDALIVYALKTHNNEFLSSLPLYAINNVRNMLGEARSIPGKDSKEKGKKLRDKYLGLFAFYYFYQNIPDENYASIKDSGLNGNENNNNNKVN